MNTLRKEKLVTKKEQLKLFIEEHKTGLAVMGTVVACGIATLFILRVQAVQINNFLKEENLFDKYYFEGEV